MKALCEQIPRRKKFLVNCRFWNVQIYLQWLTKQGHKMCRIKAFFFPGNEAAEIEFRINVSRMASAAACTITIIFQGLFWRFNVSARVLHANSGSYGGCRCCIFHMETTANQRLSLSSIWIVFVLYFFVASFSMCMDRFFKTIHVVNADCLVAAF